MERPVRFAVVGVAGYSRTHLRQVALLAEQGKARLAASTMIDKADHPDLVAEFEQNGVRVYGRYEDMLTDCHGDADIVTLPVPIHLHAPMCVAALQEGYHVLVEKPAAGCLTQVDQMIAARDVSGRQCAVGFQQIYSATIQRLKACIVEGRFGQVRRIRMMALWPRGPAYYCRNQWAGKLSCDGQPVYDSPFNNALAHQVMNMLYLSSPEPRRAAYPFRAAAELFRAYDIESFDTGCMRVQTDTGVEVLFTASHACGETVNPTMVLEAEKATVQWQLDREATVRYHDGTVEVFAEDDSRSPMFGNVITVVSGAAPAPLCTLEIARAQVACTEAIHRAAPIVSVARELVSEGKDGQRLIAGIEQAVQQSFELGCLFSEFGTLFGTLRA